MRSRSRASSTPIDEYFARVPTDMRRALMDLRRTIRSAAPDAEEVISYGMPAFRQHRVLVYYAAFKDHCSFFPGSATVRRKFSRELKRFEGGKGTFRFTPQQPIPPDLVKRIVKMRVAENESRATERRRAAKRS